jgi:hypothetical protein
MKIYPDLALAFLAAICASVIGLALTSVNRKGGGNIPVWCASRLTFFAAAAFLAAIWASVWCASRSSTLRPALAALAFLAAYYALES